MKRNLTDRFIRSAGPGFYSDLVMPTLNLRVTDSGGKSWVQRLTVQGKTKTYGLGGYPVVSLADARAKALQYRKLARAGGDPTVLHQLGGQEQKMPTFAKLAEEVITNHKKGWRPGGKSEDQWRASLRDYALSGLGDMLVCDINTEHVLNVLLPIWNTKRETARRVRQRISMIMRYAVAKRYRTDDPAGQIISEALPKNEVARRNMRALPHAQVAGCIESVRNSEAKPSIKLAFQFLVLTACRSGEARGALWSEINLNAATWVIPKTRMKVNREFRVPLSRQALEVLTKAKLMSDATGLIFRTPRGLALPESAMPKLLQRLGIDAVPHGFRASFRNWAAECSDAPREIAEHALAHSVGTSTEQAYLRTDYFEKRRSLMQQWADAICNN